MDAANTNTATALLSALALARQHGGATAALRAVGLRLEDVEQFEGLSREFGELLEGRTEGERIGEALALGLLAGRVGFRAGGRRPVDPTTFLMDRDLQVRGAEGTSILRLPWFDQELFVGRALPEISEMPTPVRRLAIEHYTASLSGERGRFSFTSYGVAYDVESVPVRGEDGRITGVLGIATPARALLRPFRRGEAGRAA